MPLVQRTYMLSRAQFPLHFIPSHPCHPFLSPHPHSWFYDAPMSHYGLEQAEELAAFLKDRPLDGPEADDIKILRADPEQKPSIFVCSPLRRAVSTLAVGFADRFRRRPDDKILILPALQEVSRNPDTLCITPPHTHIQASWIEKTCRVCDFQEIFSSQTDMSLHIGDKPLNTNGLKRMNEFCDFIFSPSVKATHVVVGGHSLWFRYFFQLFLPYSVHHVSKNKKIVNGGIVAFELMKADTRRGPRFMIDPKSIRVVYGGF